MTDTQPTPDPWVRRHSIEERPRALGPGAALSTEVWSRPVAEEGATVTAFGLVDLWCHVAGDGHASTPFVLTIHVGRAEADENPPHRWPTVPEIRECLTRFALKGAVFVLGGPLLLAGHEMEPEPVTFIQGGAIGPSPAQTRLSLTGGLGVAPGRPVNGGGHV